MQELSPALVRNGGDCVEALTVDITVKKMQIACTTAYGPQEKDPLDKNRNFGIIWMKNPKGQKKKERDLFYKETLTLQNGLSLICHSLY